MPMQERARADAQSPDALDDVYAVQRQRLLRIARRILRHREDAEDAVQEAFVRAAEAIRSGGCDPERYLAVAVRNISLNAVRDRRREVPPDLDATATEPSPELLALQREALRGAWAALSRRDRALLAHSFAGYAYDEIAERSRLSAKGVSVGLVRARDRARRWMSGTAGALVAVAGAPRRLHRALLERLGRTPQLLGSFGSPHLAAEMLALMTIGGLGGAAAAPMAATQAGSISAAGGAPHAAVADRAGAGTATPATELAHQATSAPATAAPKPAGGPQAAGPVASVPAVGTQAPYMSSVSTSPAYAQDHTLLATGTTSVGVLYSSTDGGATWQRLPALGFAGGRITFAPAWPADHRLFAATRLGVQESDDGGRSFALVAPVSGPIAAVATTSGLRLLVAAASLWTYDPATHLATPGALLPAGFIPETIVAEPSGDVVVGGAQYSAAVSTDTPLLRCAPTGSCRTIALLAGTGGAVDMVEQQGQLAVVTGYGGVYRSRDGGATFTSVDTGGQHALAISGSPDGGTALVISYTEIHPGQIGEWSRIAVTTASSSRFTPVPSPIMAGLYAIGPVSVLPVGRIVTVQTQEDSAPVAWYSDDGGAHWLRTVMASG